ncbi:thioredoxin domain-containing protein [Candidatus Nanohalobium constans]|uniref:DSBA oxidoreductase (Thioredoxin) n=1 Tax=Candidatus Nanohalobium constans TaxID=2565781 RepID=A0A5Q0UGF2_9ARCH|nr:thioredoxin domain-containing protein [Candidatus Nanohalobium constans]QGA80698.1 DSBA oxidoreductase (thioredoxin) [Candidatus Nanohalobium constans]
MTEEGLTLEFTAKQAAIFSLAAGLVVGGLGGFAAGTMAAPNQDKTGTENLDPNPGDEAEASTGQTPEETFRQISNDLELDTDKVMQCYQESDNEEALEDRNTAAQKLGGFGTPTFFVGNQEKGFVKITGAQPLSRFEQAFKTVRSDSPGNLTTLDGIELEGEPSKGDENASIKVVEYNEFGCPFCAEWQGIDASGRTPIDKMNIASNLESQYIDTGEVEFISKDYPVPQLHPNGPMAHQAANCVYEHEQDSYWDFHDELFERRDQWMAG